LKLVSRTLAALSACATLFTAPAAYAQKWITTGVSEASSGLEGGGGVTFLAQHARHFPVELGNFPRIVGELEAARDEIEELVAVFALAHTAKKPPNDVSSCPTLRRAIGI